MKITIASILITASSMFGQQAQIQQIPYETFQRMNQEQQRNIILLQETINNRYELEQQAEELEDLQRKQRKNEDELEVYSTFKRELEIERAHWNSFRH